jgi:hypothetical protein
MPERTLLSEIVHCPHARECREDLAAENPCRKIVDYQSSLGLGKFQVPEPWSGQIEQAPILFLSSNPSIGSDEDYPTWDWSYNEVHDYFNYRFGGGRKQWILDGTKSLLIDGTYSRSTRFWAAVRQRAIELLQRNVSPGIDYALTEIVHCKSRAEIGVEESQEQCVVLGARARQVIQSQFNISIENSISDSIEIGNRERFFAFLPHPNARSHRSFAKCLQGDELEKLRAFLR